MLPRISSVLFLTVQQCALILPYLYLNEAVTTSPEIPPPAAAVFVLKSSSINNKTLLNDIVNSDVEIEPGAKVELQCYGSNPVQWTYRGLGVSHCHRHPFNQFF